MQCTVARSERVGKFTGGMSVCVRASRVGKFTGGVRSVCVRHCVRECAAFGDLHTHYQHSTEHAMSRALDDRAEQSENIEQLSRAVCTHRSAMSFKF